jgi:hypothetical protein
LVAIGRYRDSDSTIESQAFRRWKVGVRVRQHADGRMIVYGGYDYSSAWASERDIVVRAGELLEAGGDPVEAIRRTGLTLTTDTDEAGVAEAVRDCIGDLPARVLS